MICTLGSDSVGETLESIEGSAERAGRRVETLVAWSGAEAPPDLNGRARFLHVFPAGLSHARNRGLTDARAPFVSFLDEDELVDPAWVGGLFDAFERDEATAGVFGPIEPRDERGLPYCHYEGGEYRVFEGARTPPWSVGTGGNMTFRRDVLLEVGGFDVLFGVGSVSLSAEETEAIVRLLQAGHRLAWAPDAVVYHPSKTEEERLASRYPYAFGMGKLARRHRDPVLVARYSKQIAQALASGARARDRRRLRETRETLRGFASAVAFKAEPESPRRALAWAPGEIAAELDGAAVTSEPPRFRPEPHLMYRVGDDRLLHVYVGPTPRLREGFAVRERLRSETGLAGIPRVFATGESTDALWVLEERLPGEAPKTGEVARWFDPVAVWALELGAARGAPVHTSSWWAEEAAGAADSAPSHLREAAAKALEATGALPSRRLHGDFQRKNLLLASNGIGVLDWEHAHEAGPPGLDMLFLAVMARGDEPDRDMLLALARDRDPAWAPLRALLERAGVEGDLRVFVLAALAVWAAAEERRVAVPGVPGSRRIYRELLEELGPALA